MDLGQLIWRITADTNDFNDGVKGTENSARGLSGTFTKLGNVIKTAFTVAGIVRFTRTVIQAAAEAQELENKYSVVFGNIADEVNVWISEYAEATARGEQDTKRFLTSLQDIRTGFGDSAEDAAEFSKVVLGVTNDLSSFSNVPVEEAFNAIQSGLSGQFEALRSLGIGLNVAIINQGEYAESINKTWLEMTNLEKQEAVLSGILTQSANAVGQNVDVWNEYDFTLGDAANTSDSFANQLQGLKGEFGDVSAEIGTKFLPLATDVVSVGRNMLKAFSELSGGAQELSLEIVGLAAAFISGGWIGAAIAGIAILAIEIADAINPIDELEDATDRLIRTNEEYNEILKELKESQDELTESEQLALETRRDLSYGELQGELLSLSDAYDRTSARVDSFRDKEEKLLEEQADLIETYDSLIERNIRTDGTLKNLETTQSQLTRTREQLNEALLAQSETVNKLASSFNDNVLNVRELISVNKELADQVINAAAVQGEYVAQVESLNRVHEQGIISTQVYIEKINELRDEAVIRQEQLANEALLERELQRQREDSAREAERLAAENEERLEKINTLAEEYRVKLFELDAEESELIEAERQRALASVEGNQQAIDAIDAYYDRLIEKRAEDEEDTRTTIEKLKDYWSEYGDYLSQLADIIFQAWADSNERQLEETLSRIEREQQAELEAAGVAEETERDRAEKALEEAINSGDAIAIAEAEANLKRLDILEKYEKERVQAQYEADLQAYNLAVTQSIINGSLATLKAFADGGLVQGLIVGALAGVEIGVVAANKPEKPSFADGGIVSGNSFTGDQIEGNLNSREMVLTQEQQATLFQMLNSGASAQQPVMRATLIWQSDSRVIAQQTVDLMNNGEYLLKPEGLEDVG